MSTPGFRPRITRTAHDAVIEHVFAHPDHEVGGVLVGRIVAEDHETVVTGAIAALEATSERASVTFTHDAWSTVHATLEREFPGQAIVGWYHSHPGFGIFLSDHDTFIQANFFSNAGQIAHVVDPQAGSEGLFGWRESEVRLIAERQTSRAGLGGPARTPPEGERRGGPPPGAAPAAGDGPPPGAVPPSGPVPPAGAGPDLAQAVADALVERPVRRTAIPTAPSPVVPLVPAAAGAAAPSPAPAALAMPPVLAGGPGPGPGRRRRGGLAVLVGIVLGFGAVAAAKADPAASPPRPVPGAHLR